MFDTLLGAWNINMSKSAFIRTKMLPVCICVDDLWRGLPEGGGNTDGLWGGRVPAWEEQRLPCAASHLCILREFGVVGTCILLMH